MNLLNDEEEAFLYQYQFLSYLEDEFYTNREVNNIEEPKAKEKQKQKEVVEEEVEIPKEEIEIMCQICLAEHNEDEGIYLNCGHFFCRESIESHIQACVDNNEVVKCPLPACDTNIMSYEVQSCICEGLKEKLEKQVLDKSLNDTISCPTPDCTNRFSIDSSFSFTSSTSLSINNKPNHNNNQNNDKGRMIICEKCFCFFCVGCREAFHYHCSCEDFKIYKVNWKDEKEMIILKHKQEKQAKKNKGKTPPKSPDTKIKSKATKGKQMSAKEQFYMDEIWKEKNCRHCPYCKHLIERVDGCDCMRCGSDNPYSTTKKLVTQNGCGKKFSWKDAQPYKMNKKVSGVDKEIIQALDKKIDEYYKFTVVQLKEMLRKKKLKVSGVKRELILRLLETDGINTEETKEKEPEPIVKIKNCEYCGAKSNYLCLECEDCQICEKCIYNQIQPNTEHTSHTLIHL